MERIEDLIHDWNRQDANVAPPESIEFDDETAELVGCKALDEQFAMMAIVNIPRDTPIEMTVNIRAPIIVHTEKRTGWQVILPNEDYPIRHRIFPDPDQEQADQ